MTDSLFSASWYRVANVRPRLRSHALIHRHLYRGSVWYVLQDRSSGRFHRFSPVANLVIGLMDGQRTLREIWTLACTRLGDDAPTQDEVIQVLASLHRADVLQTNAAPDISELHERKTSHERMKLRQYVMNPLALRIPLLDPERFLQWINPLTRWMFGWAGALVWLLIVGWALTLGASHWDELTRGISDRLLAADNLLLIGLVFPIAKIIHEFGHAFAVKARGGEVHEMGLMLLVFMPVPYVDASASLAFRSKRARMLVGAAGMLSELLLAALAMFVWVNVEPGVVRALAYNVMIVAGVSTLVFNANPLLRFDGYYILSDALEIPNFGQRANNYLGYLAKRYVFGVKTALAGELAPGERPWFVFFAITSFVYRMVVMVGIALLVAQQYFVVGVLLAMWSLFGMLIQPIAKKLAYLTRSQELQGHRRQALFATAIVLALLVGIAGWWPAPAWTRTEGVAVASQNAQIRATTDGFITRVVARPNQQVRQGELLVLTEDPELLSRVAVLQAQLNEQHARFAAMTADRVQMNIIRDEIAHIGTRLAHARSRVKELEIRSPRAGLFVMPEWADMPGRFVHRGDVIGYALDAANLAVQVVVPQNEVDLVRQMTRRVELRRVERIDEVIPAQVRRAVPAATNQLPNLALSAQGGGEVTLDAGSGHDASRPGDVKASSSLFIFELETGPAATPTATPAAPDAAHPADPAKLASLTIGSRIYAKFERQPEPLAAQWYRALRGVMLKRFNV